MARECQELRRQLQQLELANRERLQQLTELQQKLKREAENGDICKRDLANYKQQVTGDGA